MIAAIAIAKDEDRIGELDDEDIEATLREVRLFLNDPVALLERAASLLRLRSIGDLGTV